LHGPHHFSGPVKQTTKEAGSKALQVEFMADSLHQDSQQIYPRHWSVLETHLNQVSRLSGALSTISSQASLWSAGRGTSTPALCSPAWIKYFALETSFRTRCARSAQPSNTLKLNL